MRNDELIVLKEGGAWVRLRPFARRRAEVVEGTVYWPGDILRLPDTVDWTEAGKAEAGEDTPLSPFDLEIVYDALTGWWHMPQSLGGGVLERIGESEDVRVRAILEAIASQDEVATRERRRKGAA